MTSPRFSIVLPTKNRPQLAAIAVDSVLRQTFPDFEVVVVDNNEDDRTATALADVRDPRFRRVATGGLSMPDNWEEAVAAASGDYVCILEDKQVLKRDALARIEEAVAGRQVESVRWQTDALVDVGLGKRLRRGRRIVERPTEMACGEILRTFAASSYGISKRLLPLGHFSAVHRSLLERIRESPLGRVCPPRSPDYTLAFGQLALGESVLLMPDSLVAFSTVAVSNGANARRKQGGADAMARELGRAAEEAYDLVPIKAITVANGIYNDFLHMRDALGGHLAEVSLDWAVYFRECFESFGQSALLGVDVELELVAWEEALAAQDTEIQRRSLELLQIRGGQDIQSAFRRRYRPRSGWHRLRQTIKGLWRTHVRRDPAFRFTCIEQFLEWDFAQRNPSPPSA